MYRSLATIFSAVLWVLLPKCGLCLMAYAGIFSALGLGGLLKAKLLLPLMIALIVLNLVAVIYMSVVKKEYTYAILSLAGAALFVVNKLYIGSLAVNIIAGVVLVLAMLQVRFFQVKSKQCVFKSKKTIA
ncbi:MAG: hypothetical protein QM726_12675 [Chitinophagaceae bacterium]